MNDTITLTPAMLALVPTVAMILQILKKIPIYEKIKSYTPLIACGIGITAAYATALTNPIVAGILIGVSASAGYSQFKEVTKTNGAK